MLNIYTSYICCSCRKEFVLLSEDIETMEGYLVCPYCSSRKVRKENVKYILKECMNGRSYKKVHGVIRQKI